MSFNLGFQYFLKIYREYYKGFNLAVFFMLAETAISLSIPWYAGYVGALLLEEESLDFIEEQWWMLAVWLLLFSMQALLRFASTYSIQSVGARLLTWLSCRLYDHIQILPMNYFRETRRGEVLALMTNDVTAISYFVSGALATFISNSLFLFGAVIIMYRLDPMICLMIMGLIPAFFILLKLASRKLKPISSQLIQRQADSMAHVGENLQAISVIKAFNKEQGESEKFRGRAEEILALRQKQLKTQAMLSPLFQLLASTGIFGIVLISALRFQSGQLEASHLISLLLYGLMFTRPVSSLAALYGQVQQALGASERLSRLFQLSPEPQSGARGKKPVDLQGEIKFDQVTFGYKPERLLIKQADFTASPGQWIALTGANGSGKTSLLHLIMRFSDPLKGTITIDGIDLKEFNLSWLRTQIGYVSQDVLLCNASVYENIAYGFDEPSPEQVYEAARKAGVEAFIDSFSEGYETRVGENGILLSGGQKQRISLARAILRKPRILLLDEPTSMQDGVSSQLFCTQSRRLLEGITVIMVTHDKQLAQAADQVYELSELGVSEVPIDQKRNPNELSAKG